MLKFLKIMYLKIKEVLLNVEKLNIHVLKIGYFPYDIHYNQIKKWKSKLFKLDCREYEDALKTLHKKDGVIYDDIVLLQVAKSKFSKTNFEKNEFVVLITNVDLADGDLSRILDEHIVVISYREIVQEMKINNIPLENATLVLLYMYSLLFMKYKRIPNIMEEEYFLHMDVRGCIFDYDDKCTDMIQCCVQPIICKQCEENLNDLDMEILNTVRKELGKIKKNLYYRMTDLLKKHFYISFLMTLWIAIICSTVSSFFTGKWMIVLVLVPVVLLFVVIIVEKIKAKIGK